MGLTLEGARLGSDCPIEAGCQRGMGSYRCKLQARIKRSAR